MMNWDSIPIEGNASGRQYLRCLRNLGEVVIIRIMEFVVVLLLLLGAIHVFNKLN